MKDEDKIAREAKDVLTGRKPIVAFKDGNVFRIFVKNDDVKKLDKFCNSVKDYLMGGVNGYNDTHDIVSMDGECICIIEVQSSEKLNIIIDRWKCLCRYMNISDEIAEA